MIEIRVGPAAFDAEAFLALAQRVWPRDYHLESFAKAVASTLNVGAWEGSRLVGAVRVLTDGYLFSTVPEIIVDPDFQRQGIGRRLLEAALDLAPGGKLFLGAREGNEPFFEKCGFVRGPTGFVGRRRP